jgi:hypothetical protein
MFDTLVYCYVMLNFKHGGHILVAAALVRALDARYRALQAALVRLWRGTTPPRRQSVSGCYPPDGWSQSLTRLETYVTSMA